MRNSDGFYRGINLGGWISQCGPNYNEQHYMSFVTEDDIAKIADMGLDHVRMPVDYNVIQTEDGELIESGMKHIEDCVNCCISDLFLCDVETFLLVEDLVVTASINDTDDVCLFESSLLDDLFHCC